MLPTWRDASLPQSPRNVITPGAMPQSFWRAPCSLVMATFQHTCLHKCISRPVTTILVNQQKFVLLGHLWAQLLPHRVWAMGVTLYTTGFDLCVNLSCAVTPRTHCCFQRPPWCVWHLAPPSALPQPCPLTVQGSAAEGNLNKKEQYSAPAFWVAADGWYLTRLPCSGIFSSLPLPCILVSIFFLGRTNPYMW